MSLDRHIFDKIAHLEELQEIKKCIQCGTCSGSCPLHEDMEHSPRALFAMLKDYETTAALRSNTMWFCVSCYACTTRCPRQIPITNIMYRLKEISQKFQLVSNEIKMNRLYQAFNQSIIQTGKANETLIMRQFGQRYPKVVLKSLKLGLKLLGKKRLPLGKQTTNNPTNIKRLFTHHQ